MCPPRPRETLHRALTDPSARTRPREERLTNIVAEGELRRRLKRRVDLFGLTRVARELGVGREALARYGAEFDLHAGTRVLIEQRLTSLDSGPSEPGGTRCSS